MLCGMIRAIGTIGYAFTVPCVDYCTVWYTYRVRAIYVPYVIASVSPIDSVLYVLIATRCYMLACLVQ